MSAIDDVLGNNADHASKFDKAGRPKRPARKLAIVTCMDARVNAYALLGLEEGDAHVISNAGGVITDDEIRSLTISQLLLGTEEIMLIHHTDCGMLQFTGEDFKRSLAEETGVVPQWSVGTFTDLDQHVRDSMAFIRENPFIPRKDSIRGFVYEVESGRLREVDQ